MITLGLDIGSNSVGSAWIDWANGQVTTGTSIFPAGVDESDDKRGEPKNAKRRMTRRTRITLARRAARKRLLRLKLIEAGLLPKTGSEFTSLLEESNPWDLRRKALVEPLSPYQFGRVLLHLAQRRGALGLKIEESDNPDDQEDGKVKAAIGAVREKMKERKAGTFGEFIAMVQAERVTAITTEDQRPIHRRTNPREYRSAIRNKAGSYEHCADRSMIRYEFGETWNKQKKFAGPLGAKLTDELRLALDDESGDSVWRHKGLLFGQRRQSWDLGTLGRCVLNPAERCAPHADMYASQFLVVETINNLRIIDRGKEPRALTPEEREKIKRYLSGPLGLNKIGKQKGQPKRSVSVTDLRELMEWGRANKTSQFHFNIESDEERTINTDWFSREIIHGAITPVIWDAMPPSIRDGVNHAILKYDPDEETHSQKLKDGVLKWAGLNETQADTMVAAWKKRPRPDAKRLNMSRRAVRNLLTLMDRAEPWTDTKQPNQLRWLTPIEARKLIAENADFVDVTSRLPIDQHTRRRYATGSRGATARDRHYMRKHVLTKNGEPVIGPDDKPLAEPPPAPLISNPVVRKAIHEVRRHLIEYMKTFGRKPDRVFVELSREAKMGKKESDELLFRNRLRNRIRNDIIRTFGLEAATSTQQRTAVDRVILAVQQSGFCPFCGQPGLTPLIAHSGTDCDFAHIIPKGSGGHNGLGNLVLAHRSCNQIMGRRTPRQYWEASLKGGFEAGFRFVEGIYRSVQRPKPSEVKNATGDSLWSCYFAGKPGRFTPSFDMLKVEQFKKDVKDIQEMTNRQDAATKYAARQVMSYLADALYDGAGLPERGGDRKIFATDGMWTSRFRREWGLFFDSHGARVHDLSVEEKHLRKEKNRGDHRHHAVDAAITAACWREMQIAWENREKQADKEGINTADEEAMENYRRRHPLVPPEPFKTRDEFRESLRLAVYGDGSTPRPICHRPVKRKLIGAMHEETLFSPVLSRQGELTDKFTARPLGRILDLDPNHLRLPRPETKDEAIGRLAARRIETHQADSKTAPKWARSVVSGAGFTPLVVDPPPGKSGLVRDVGLRRRLRQCLSDAGLNPDDFKAGELKKLVEAGKIRQASGVPINSMVLLRTISDPVIVPRKRIDYSTQRTVPDDNAASFRAYVGGNNHHIEIRVAKDKRGNESWSGEIVTAFQAAQRKLARLRAFRKAGVPKFKDLRKLPIGERAKLKPLLRDIERAHPVVDRSDVDEKGGRFVMSLSEGEMLSMKHKQTGELGYFVVAKLDKPQAIVLVPHWDARAATERKDAEGKKVADSKREQFAVTPSDLAKLAPEGRAHAVKVRVSPLGVLSELEGD